MAEIPGPITEQNRTEHLSSKRPEFDGGAFTISAFSPEPGGFQIRTRNVLGRTEGVASNHLDPNRTNIVARTALLRKAESQGASAQEIKRLEQDIAEERAKAKGPNATRLRDAMKGEMTKYNNVQAVIDARTAWKTAGKNGVDANQVAQLEEKFYEERETYQEKGKKVGIRNITREGNVITADAKYVSFPIYDQFAHPEDSPELIDLSAISAGAMIIRSKDGRLVIQHRAVKRQRLTEPKLSRGNSQFADLPGASAAGTLDASLQREDRKVGRPDPIDTDSVKGSLLKEVGEELGLHDDDLSTVRIVGLAHDKIKIHDELLLLADADLTAEQIREKSRTSKKNKVLGDADFEEKFIDIDGSPESIATLLTQVKCPLPPTHAAALVAAGYSLVLQEHDKAAADTWKSEVEQGVKQNYQEIGAMVKNFYLKHPEAKKQVPERFWGQQAPERNPNRYTPDYTPDEQGLPSFEDAMVDAGLVPETRRLVPEADLFDVDGVITDPTTKEVIHPEILDKIAERLKAGIPVALNTGRSIEWLKAPVLAPLLDRFKDDKSGLTNFALIGEFGGTWATFDESGNIHEGQVESLAVPQALHEKSRTLVEQEYSKSMEYDKTKRTMLSIEMHKGYDLDAFHEAQTKLVDDLNTLVTEAKLSSTYIVHRDTIATNVMSPNVGKDLGAARFLQFLRDLGVRPARYRTFGDSMSDIAMTHELVRHGYPAEFVFVGKAVDLEKARTDGKIKEEETIINVGNYSEGTQVYLSKN
ncbi:MAG: hypothetical protein ACREHC_00935 [Candidatus Levyibacteriota bacterium]